MIIGNFTYDRTRDTYTGELATLTVAVRKVVFSRARRGATRRQAIAS
jgi:hypothetical protein